MKVKARLYVKSSRSGTNGECVEWAFETEQVFVRDSKNPTGPELVFSHQEWESLVAAAVSATDHPNLKRSRNCRTIHRGGVELLFTPREWDAFVVGALAGECAVPTGRKRLQVLPT